MNSLAVQRQAIKHLLDERNPADAMAAYYAFYHADGKTRLVTTPPDASRAAGYVSFSKTGIDLFRPLITMRLPKDDMQSSADLIQEAIPVGTASILQTPASYKPLLHALFDIQTEEELRLYVLDPARFEPIINVLVVQTTSPDGLTRFVIRSQAPDRHVAASAGMNWRSPHYVEISVHTSAGQRRRGYGRSVVAAMVQHIRDQDRTPLYVVSSDNPASIQLAESVGFVDSGHRQVIIHALKRQ